MAHDGSGKARGLGPIIGAAMYESTDTLGA
jgi:hypothetical protein